MQLRLSGLAILLLVSIICAMASTAPETRTPENDHADVARMIEAAPSNDDTVHKLDMSEGFASIELGKLFACTSYYAENGKADLTLPCQTGPVVINEDGTMSRIANWEKMTQAERDNTSRVLKIRNAKRLKKLKEQEETAQNAGRSDSAEKAKAEL